MAMIRWFVVGWRRGAWWAWWDAFAAIMIPGLIIIGLKNGWS
jgi:hypothetical protein